MDKRARLPKDVLARIGALTADELVGWWSVVCVWRLRPAKPGEQALLCQRARELGVKL